MSEDQVREAERVLYRAHYSHVRATAIDVLEDVLSGRIYDADALHTRLHEEAETAVTYTRDAERILFSSENSDAYEDETGEKAPSVEAAAAMAFKADVRDLLGNEYFLADEAHPAVPEGFDLWDDATWRASEEAKP